MRRLLVTAALIMVFAAPVFAAPGYLGGYNGTILVPDGLVTPTGQWDLSFHDNFNLVRDDDLQAWGVQYGLVNKLEVGVSLVNTTGTKVAISGKYRLVEETASAPIVAVGVFDAAGQIDDLDGDASVYIVISKNITPFASRVANTPSKPIRLTIGGGSGIFNGFMGSVDWVLEPRFSVQAEYFGGHVGDRDHFWNAGLRYAVSDNFRLDAAVLDLKELGVGVSYRSSFK